MSATLNYDTGPLNWVRSDIEAALQGALGRVQAFSADADLTNALRLARDDAHQVVGALRMVGLEGAATVAAALETTLADIDEGRQASGDEVFRAVRNGLEGLSRWIKELADGRGNGELALFPLYKRLRELQGAERVFEGELFFPDLRSRVHGAPRVVEQAADMLTAQVKTARAHFQRGLLAFLRAQGAAQGLKLMRQALADVEKVAPSQAAQTFWWACVGFIDSLIAQGVEADFHVKQLLARIDLQMRRLMEGSPQVAERLLRDALFFVAKSQTLDGRAAEVRATFSLDQYLPGKGLLDPETMARLRPVLGSLKSGLKSARDCWQSHVENAAIGESENFRTQLERMQPQASLLETAGLPQLLKNLVDAGGASSRLAAEQQESLNLEIAATLLFLQNAVESEEILRTDFTTRANSQSERLSALVEGRALPQAEALLDSRSQAAAERELLHHLAEEVSNNLKQIEEGLDLFFRDAGQRNGLAQLPPIAAQAQGALAMLDLHDAADLLAAAMRSVDAYAIDGYPTDSIKGRIADAFSSLGLYIEAHCAGRADALRILQPVLADFGLPTSDTFTESATEESIEAGLDRRKAGVAAAYLAWRDEGGEEQPKKFLENLVELGRDAELIDDAILKRGVDALITTSGENPRPNLALDAQVSLLTNVSLPPRADLSIPDVAFAPLTETPDVPNAAERDFDSAESALSAAPETPLSAALPVDERPAASDTLAQEGMPIDALPVTERADSSVPADIESVASLLPTDAALGVVSPDVPPEDAAPESVMAAVPEDCDPELLEIFLEEAGEVLVAMADAVEACSDQPESHENLVVIRRGFHTLKGSGRMVGLMDLGEAAWGMEQFMNAWLAEKKPASDALQAMVSEARRLFQRWIEALQTLTPLALPVPALLAAAERVTQGLPFMLAVAEADVVTPPVLDSAAGGDETTERIEIESFEPVQDDMPIEMLAETEGSAPTPSDVDSHDAVDTQPESEALADESVPDLAEPEAPDLSVGDIHISAGLFDIFMTEAQQRLESLLTEIARLNTEKNSIVNEGARRAAHTLGGIAGTAGFTSMSELAHALERYWNRFEQNPMPEAHRPLVGDIVLRLEEMRVQIAGFTAPQSGSDLIAALGELEDEPVFDSAEIPHDNVIEPPLELLASAEIIDACEATLSEEVTPSAASTEEAPCFSAMIEYAVAPAHSAAPELADPGFDESATPPSAALVEEAQAECFSTLIEYAVPPPTCDIPEIPASVTPVESEAIAEVTPPPDVLDVSELVPETPKTPLPVFERRDVTDEIDMQLLPVFTEEADTLIPDTSLQLRLWKTGSNNLAALDTLRRNLHTLKGSARMVGAMRLGELTHVMESRVIAIVEGELEASAADFDALEAQLDRLANAVERLKQGDLSHTDEAPLETPVEPVETPATATPHAAVTEEVTIAAQPIVRDTQALTLRVRADWVDRMVNQAGEVAIARSRIESEVFNFKRHVGELSDALVRLRGHIREVEIQAESQMQSTFLTQGTGDHFDPLEFDRFTRFQEVTRFLAESVNDISTVQHILLARLGEADAALLHQTRLNRELQQNLLRVRMVPIYSVSERLYRTVRQTARDVNKRAQLDIHGGDLEIDRSVLEKITAPLEHLLRNALAHGIESAEGRQAAGKPESGEITLTAQQAGNEMLLTIKDDGAGLNFARIREKALAQGILTEGIEPSETQLAQLIFAAGLSTADAVSEVSGRGVGMDVVKSEIAALGGRIDISSTPGKGTQFSIYLPLTMAMTQAVMFSAGKQDYALPATLVQQVLELKPEPLTEALTSGEVEWRGTRYPLSYLPHLLGHNDAVHEMQRYNAVVLLKSGNSQAAILVDAIEGTREIVVKNIGPQLARVTGIAGATVRGDGRVILILNPVPLALRWMHQPQEARDVQRAEHHAMQEETLVAPLVLVVDDSLTVRKITGRLLTREGYRMDTAKDGVDALEKMQDLIPDVVLLDVEMPRMDGFELARVMRNDVRLKDIPIIMITSRTAEKHRNHALELGVNVYMGKPYQEQQLLENITDLLALRVTV